MKFLLEYSRYNDGTKICNGWWKISADEKYVENRAEVFMTILNMMTTLLLKLIIGMI